MHKPDKDTRHTRQRGFTLVEVLIAVVVLSVGLLGLAQLQVNGMRSTNSAYLRSQATIMAGDIIDSMRANRTNAVAGAYDIAMTANIPGSTETVADSDLVGWLTNLTTLLPNADGSIVRAGNIVTVTVEWHDSRQYETESTILNAGGISVRQFSVDTVL